MQQRQQYIGKKRSIFLVSYYGQCLEPIASAVAHINNSENFHVCDDCPMLQWRSDANDRRADYLDAAVLLFARNDIVLFWYHSLTAVEMKYLRSRVSPETKFALFTWDDPYDWHSPFQNCAATEQFYDCVFSCCSDSLAQYSSVPVKRFVLPGFQSEWAAAAVESLQGPNRFTCDICMLCTNLYADAAIYPHQQINRKELLDAIYAQKQWVFHLYGPEQLRTAYPDAYRGFVGVEQT